MFLLTWGDIRDVWTVVGKEIKELAVANGLNWFAALTTAVALGVFGGLLPWFFGHAWIDRPLLIAIWLALPIPLVILASAESFAGERERHTLETLLATRLSTHAILLGKVVAATLFGWLASLVVLAAGLFTVNLTHEHTTPHLYSLSGGATILGLGFLVALFTACVGVLASQDAANVRQARITLTLTISLILVGVTAALIGVAYFLPGLAELAALSPTVLLTAGATVLLVIADLSLYTIAAIRFSRPRLIAC